MAEEFNSELGTVVDEEGVQHQFELIDAIETDDGRYVALLPVYDEAQDIVDDDGELIILEVTEEDGEEVLGPIENDELFDNIAAIFEDRLADLFEFDEASEE